VPDIGKEVGMRQAGVVKVSVTMTEENRRFVQAYANHVGYSFSKALGEIIEDAREQASRHWLEQLIVESEITTGQV
jgi:hypothetical protein